MLKRFFQRYCGLKPSYKLGLALQGGGSYGAYTKGVLKALLEQDINIAAISGTSAGAVNAALLAYGLNMEGRAEASRLLDGFWDDIASDGAMVKSLLFLSNPLAYSSVKYPNLSAAFNFWAAMVPSGQLGKEIKTKLDKYIKNWNKLQTGPVKTFVNATRIDPQTGTRSQAIFTGTDLTVDAVVASGALEEFGAKTIDGVDYLDGAYWRNPSIEELIDENITDLLVITIQRKPDRITPAHQDDLRNSHQNPGHEILGEEIHHHLAYLKQKRPDIRLHVISLDVEPHWDRSSRMNTDPKWLTELEDIGYSDGRKWIATYMNDLGVRSSYKGSPPSATDNPKTAP